VISPAGCASILIKKADRAKEAAEAMRITAKDLIENKLVDEIIPEPLGGAHRDPAAMAVKLKERLLEHLDRLCKVPMTRLLSTRYERLMSYGTYEEPQVVTPMNQAAG
jgi:acetyl-CoA carboxylase carboxyl transferase subunit alpha